MRNSAAAAGRVVAHERALHGVRRAEPAVIHGARLFDEQAFFEAHEVWEERWRVAEGEERRVLQGLIQIAAALHKLLVMKSPAPASRLFTKGLAKLEHATTLDGIDVARFRERARACAAALETGRFEPAAIPRFSAD